MHHVMWGLVSFFLGIRWCSRRVSAATSFAVACVVVANPSALGFHLLGVLAMEIAGSPISASRGLPLPAVRVLVTKGCTILGINLFAHAPWNGVTLKLEGGTLPVATGIDPLQVHGR